RLEIALIGIKSDPLRARFAGAALHNLAGCNRPLIQTLEMRIRILSDLHREIETADLLDDAADVVVLADDIDHGIKGVVGARQAFPGIPVLYVAGNHEHYDERIGSLHEKLRETADGSNVTLLENETIEL